MTIEEAFEYFIFAKNSQGLTEKTIHSYRDHLHCISKYLDTSIALSLCVLHSIFRRNHASFLTLIILKTY